MSSQSILGKLGISGLNSDSSGFAQPRSFLRIHITAQGLAGVLTAQVLGERAESALPALALSAVPSLRCLSTENAHFTLPPPWEGLQRPEPPGNEGVH